MASALSLILRGTATGVFASLVQALVGKTEEKLLLPSWENSNIAPRLIHRLGRGVGTDPPESVQWILGTVFHLGYGATWGTIYAAANERLRLHPLAGGALLGGVIYGITFPRWGVAVQTRTERPPHVRTGRMTFVALSVAFTYGLVTAYADEALRERI